MVKNLEEVFPMEISEDLDGFSLFKYIVDTSDLVQFSESGIAMSSGCAGCATGGGCTAGFYSDITIEKDVKYEE